MVKSTSRMKFKRFLVATGATLVVYNTTPVFANEDKEAFSVSDYTYVACQSNSISDECMVELMPLFCFPHIVGKK